MERNYYSEANRREAQPVYTPAYQTRSYDRNEVNNPLTASPIRTISPYSRGKENINANMLASNKQSLNNFGQTLQFSYLDNLDPRYEANPLLDKDNLKDQSLEYKLLRMSKELDREVKAAVTETTLKDALSSSSNQINKLKSQIQALEEKNKQLKQNEEILARDLIKQETISRETIKAMEKLIHRSDDEKNVIIKTYEERMLMTEDRNRIGFEVKEQAMQDMINVLKDEINQLTSANRHLEGGAKRFNELTEENSKLKEENDNLRKTLQHKELTREQEKVLIRQQINQMKEELYSLRENSNMNNISIKEETVSLREELLSKDTEINRLKKLVEDAENDTKQSTKNNFTLVHSLEQKLSFYIEENAILKANFETCKGENQMLRRQFEDQRDIYEDKIRRRDDHRKKKKQEWTHLYNQLKEENEYLRNNTNCFETPKSGINADQILSELMRRTNSTSMTKY